MNTVDGRQFISDFLVDNCGVDPALGIPSRDDSEFNRGIRKPAIDLLNLLLYHCNESFLLMNKEQQSRRNSNE